MSRVETLRAFIAVELPEETADALGRLQQQLRSQKLNLRWVRPENIHLTLKFLGDIQLDQAAAVGEAVAAAANDFTPFKLKPAGIGLFPGLSKPRVLWVGTAGDTDRLRGLQQAVDAALAAIGFAAEKRAFKGHLTLGRAKGRVDPQTLKQALRSVGPFEAGEFVVEKVTLFKSELKPSGAVYSHLKEMALGRTMKRTC